MMSGSSMCSYPSFSQPTSALPYSGASSTSSQGEAKDVEGGEEASRVMTRGEEACGEGDRRPGGRRASGRSVMFKGVDV